MILDNNGNIINTIENMSFFGDGETMAHIGNTTFATDDVMNQMGSIGLSSSGSITESGNTFFGSNGAYTLSGTMLFGPNRKTWTGISTTQDVYDIILHDSK